MPHAKCKNVTKLIKFYKLDQTEIIKQLHKMRSILCCTEYARDRFLLKMLKCARLHNNNTA